MGEGCSVVYSTYNKAIYQHVLRLKSQAFRNYGLYVSSGYIVCIFYEAVFDQISMFPIPYLFRTVLTKNNSDQKVIVLI